MIWCLWRREYSFAYETWYETLPDFRLLVYSHVKQGHQNAQFWLASPVSGTNLGRKLRQQKRIIGSQKVKVKDWDSQNSTHYDLDFWRGRTDTYLSQLAELLWTDPGIKSGISVRKLISTLKKKAQVKNKWSKILPKSSQASKKAPPPPPSTYSSWRSANKSSSIATTKTVKNPRRSNLRWPSDLHTWFPDAHSTSLLLEAPARMTRWKRWGWRQRPRWTGESRGQRSAKGSGHRRPSVCTQQAWINIHGYIYMDIDIHGERERGR